jgi:hypothetical protein
LSKEPPRETDQRHPAAADHSFYTEACQRQLTNGTISGIVFDSDGKAIPGAGILIVNDATGISYPGETNAEGSTRKAGSF